VVSKRFIEAAPDTQELHYVLDCIADWPLPIVKGRVVWKNGSSDGLVWGADCLEVQQVECVWQTIAVVLCLAGCFEARP
jgi:hypothetical protein